LAVTVGVHIYDKISFARNGLKVNVSVNTGAPVTAQLDMVERGTVHKAVAPGVIEG
jgi:hypothetical protein